MHAHIRVGGPYGDRDLDACLASGVSAAFSPLQADLGSYMLSTALVEMLPRFVPSLLCLSMIWGKPLHFCYPIVARTHVYVHSAFSYRAYVAGQVVACSVSASCRAERGTPNAGAFPCFSRVCETQDSSACRRLVHVVAFFVFGFFGTANMRPQREFRHMDAVGCLTG